MNKVHYLEPDEEITKVIKRIRTSEEDGVILVVPRNSALTQSVINLKLLKRSAAEHQKMIGLVSTDRITKNLAEQLKVQIFGKVAEAEKAILKTQAENPPAEPFDSAQGRSADGLPLKVNKYKKYDLSGLNEEPSSAEATEGKQGGENIEDEDIKLSKKPIAGDDEKETKDQRLKTEDTTEYEPEAELENIEPIDFAQGRPEFDEPVSLEISEENDSKVDEPFDSASPSAEATEDRQDEPVEEKMERIKSNKEEIKMDFGRGNKHRHIRTGGSRKPLIVLFSLILIILVVAVGLFLPSAQATVTLKTTDAEQKAAVSIDQNQKAFDSTKNVLNGTAVELEKTTIKSFNSTGKKDAGATASGTITISNSADTKAIPVSPGAKVTASGGQVFTVTSGVLVPGATVSNCQIVGGKFTCDTTPGTIDAKVTASATGDTYNLAANTTFTVASMTATNKAAFSGGVTKSILFVTDADLANAEKAIETQTQTDNQAELLDNVTKANLKAFDKYINLAVISFSADKNANDTADTFNATLDAKLSVLAFSETDLRAAMVTLADVKIGANLMLVNPENSDLTYAVSGYSADTNVLKLDVDFKAKTGAKMSADLLKKNLKGKNLTTAQSYLVGLDGAASASIQTSPKIWRMMPFLTGRIHVNFDYQK